MSLIDRLWFWSTDNGEQQQEQQEDVEETKKEKIGITRERYIITINYHDGETVTLKGDEYSKTVGRIEVLNLDYGTATFYAYDVPHFNMQSEEGVLLDGVESYNVEKEAFKLEMTVEVKYINGDRDNIGEVLSVEEKPIEEAEDQ